MKKHLCFIFLIAVMMAACLPEKVARTEERGIKRQTPILSIDTGGHMAVIRDIMFTKDGNYLISASDDKTVRVWDVQTGDIVRVIRGQIAEGPEGKIFAAALSPDNRWLAVGGMMATFTGNNHQKIGKIRLIDFRTGEVVRLLKGHENGVLGLAFSPDSTRLISGSFDKTARIWDIESGKILHILSGHTDFVFAVAFSPEGARAVTGSDDDTLRLWDLTTHPPFPSLLKREGELTAHEDDVVSAAFTPDGKYLLSGSWDKSIRLWDGKTGKFIKVLASQGSFVENLSISPDSKLVLTGHSCLPSSIEYINNIFSIPEGKKLLSFTKHDSIVLATAVSPDGRLAATGGGSDQEIYLWDIRTGNVKQRLAGKGKVIWSVGFGRDGRTVAWGKTLEHEILFGYGKLEQSFFLGDEQDLRLSMGEKIPPNPIRVKLR